MKVAIYGLAGLLFGLSGVMQMSRLRQGDPTVAIGTELDVIAAVVIGGGSLNGGVGTILGSMIGASIMAVLRNGSQQMGWPNYIQEIIIGAIIVVAVALDRVRSAKSLTRELSSQPERHGVSSAPHAAVRSTGISWPGLHRRPDARAENPPAPRGKYSPANEDMREGPCDARVAEFTRGFSCHGRTAQLLHTWTHNGWSWQTTR